ncbi:MAG TPA: hypothetical protein VD886_01600 [Herpetosiphonaceae bacterium]|nr:hypothetical protein [Herpetosiphonaceae bacterium]
MRRPFSILLLLLSLAACANPPEPAALPAPAIPAAPLSGGLIVYARSVAPGPTYEHRQSDLLVVDELGHEQRTLPITNVIQGFATKAPNTAIYRTTAGYFLVDAALGTVKSLPMAQRHPFGALVPADHPAALGTRQMIMHISTIDPLSNPSPVNYLVDLERGTAVELNALLNARDGDNLTVILSPDEKYALVSGIGQQLALIPTADPQSWRTLATDDWHSDAVWSADSQSVIYTGRSGTDERLLRVNIAGGTPATLFEGQVYALRLLRDSNHILLSDDQGLLILDLASGARRRIDRCAAQFQLMMSDNDETLLCPGEYEQEGWDFVDLRSGSATLLPELAGSVPRSPEHQRWAVFGTGFVRHAIIPKPARIVDVRAGRIVASSADDDIIGVASDGSAALVSNEYLGRKVWLYGSDGSGRLIYQADQEATASFSPDARFILLSNTLYATNPAPGPISVLDRSGNRIRTLEIPGIHPLWLEP